MKTEQVLDEIRKTYEPYAEIAVSEIQRVDTLRKEWEKTKDPEWLAFRDNPKTQELFKTAVNTYKALYKQAANDDGSLTQMDRKAIDVGKKWALWFIRSLGGNPAKIRRQVESEVLKFANDMGIKI